MFLIDNKNIEEWGICTGFDIGTPSIVTKTYEVPGRNGSIDASEALTGRVTYGNRTITIELVLGGLTQEEFQLMRDEIYAYCHGKVRKITYLEDADFYYEGRLEITPYRENAVIDRITIVSDCQPYAFKKELTQVSQAVNASAQITLQNAGMPTKLTVETDAEIGLIRELTGKVVFSPGKHLVSYPLLSGSGETVKLEGNANVTISYQEGKL